MLIETQIKMMDRKESGIFNLGSGSPRSFLDVARNVALLYNSRIEAIPFPDHLRSHYQEYTHADMYRISMIL